ncbi:hypothetical protein LOTGIDRAFT_225752 [Lottia gigantea]|uniref:CSN8/PSMD8/EIF3K domain-containing protein n=1 Tax=Lottia gigantea TaxID=225164 RepID=V4CFG1_LOTGI|nr:hypothetical protein LOTGIDRAFT_225752 [Lottia gigantea]ESP00760.1 hypothetical protein LOTGIDRAFT_225752 [Lottia gigantea]
MAVIGENKISKMDFVKLGQDLENQELEAPAGVATPQIYGQLLAVYLLQNDTCNAKFLWKRIPTNLKTGELSLVWAVGQKVWQRDHPSVYDTLKQDWSEDIKPIMTALKETIHERAFKLVSLAYSSIHSEDLAAFIGLTVPEAIQAVKNRGWTVDAQSKIITPKKPEKLIDPPLSSDHQLSVLTDYVSFLEN